MAEAPESGWRSPAPAPAPAPAQSDYEPIHPGSGRGDWRERLKRVGGPIAAGLILLATKLKAVLLLLPKLKILTTSATMLVSIAAYALIWGWTFAVGFVLLLLVHEMGHVIQLRREGIHRLGADVHPIPRRGRRREVDGRRRRRRGAGRARRAVLGSLAHTGPARDLVRDRERVLAGARLRRLLHQPLQPVAGAAARRRPRDGGALALGLVRWLRRTDRADDRLPEPDPFLVLVFGGLESWRRFKQRKTPESRAYHAIPARTRTLVAVVYIGLAVGLAVGVARPSSRRSLDSV